MVSRFAVLLLLIVWFPAMVIFAAASGSFRSVGKWAWQKSSKRVTGGDRRGDGGCAFCWCRSHARYHRSGRNFHGSLYRSHLPTNQASVYSASSSPTIVLEIPTAQDTEEVGALLSALILENYISDNNDDDAGVQEGTTIFLDGDLGAGKTAFARGFLRAATGDDNLRVTSPTYLLVNVYPILGGRSEIHHMDLYRLSGSPEDLVPLNLEHVFRNCISLIEWPERFGSTPIPENRLDINIRIQSGNDANNEIGSDGDSDDESGEDDKARVITLTPHGPLWESRIALIMEEGYLDDLLL